MAAEPPSPYTLLFPLAEGGMGFVEVVRKRDGRFERLYARKRLRPHYRDDPAFRAMFMEEARTAGLVRHPNVVGVIDVGADADGPYLIMELVEGVPASRLIGHVAEHHDELPVQIAVRVALDASRGLHAAHEARGADGTPLGLVHRDVSPQNLLVGYDGITRVADFGIAKALGAASRTSTGVLKGSMGYLSPEQLRFEEPDRRSDLFSLGVTLYELLAGERLYPNREGFDGARRILDEAPPDIGERRSDVPPELVALLFRLLAKRPESRPGSAEEIVTALEEILAALVAEEGLVDVSGYLAARFDQDHRQFRERIEEARQAAAAPPPRKRRPLPWIAAAMAVVLLAAGGGWALLRTGGSEAPPEPIWAGGWHTCTLAGDKLLCWGKNNEGQLGIGDLIDRLTAQRGPVRMKQMGVPRSLSLGWFHTCACSADGKVFCWGRNQEGQLGSATGVATEPRVVPVVDDCVQVAANGNHSCALRRDGTVWCWGQNASGQAGQPLEETIARPAMVAGLTDVVEVSLGGDATCVRRRAGDVHCWGLNSVGQLGDGTTVQRERPAPISGLTDAVQLGLGRDFGCATRRSGRVACWGGNERGALGRRPRTAGLTPVDVPGVEGIVQVSAGGHFACARDGRGMVQCWGQNVTGELGQGMQSSSRGPSPVTGLPPVTSLVSGDGHSCVRHGLGVSCWGLNETGQLGDGTTERRLRPVSAAGVR